MKRHLRHWRCLYCDSDMFVSAEAYKQNPFCAGCLHERMEKVSAELGPFHWERDGDYMRLVRDGVPPDTRARLVRKICDAVKARGKSHPQGFCWVCDRIDAILEPALEREREASRDSEKDRMLDSHECPVGMTCEICALVGFDYVEKRGVEALGQVVRAVVEDKEAAQTPLRLCTLCWSNLDDNNVCPNCTPPSEEAHPNE